MFFIAVDLFIPTSVFPDSWEPNDESFYDNAKYSYFVAAKIMSGNTIVSNEDEYGIECA